MTFEEALELKNNTNLNDYLELSNPFVLVVPRNLNDFTEYMEEFYYAHKLDDRAKLFSKNNDFGVFVFHTFDVNRFVYKDITNL